MKTRQISHIGTILKSMERRMRWKVHVRCGAGEKVELPKWNLD